ncbi:prefoldin subunit 6-like [Panonychus citri]|uniref:prefoldin subunit 6-like n=1 Tax=Panonychus citri TaxID=50023 RepID=UPI0023074780|nr:prefoldin subunit 6-like [Panonychus citri]
MEAPKAAVSAKLAEEIAKFSSIQKDYQKVVSTHQQLDEQLNENNIVKQELDLLDDSDNVYKLIGPALIKQELKEAKDNVQNRIKYITGEMKKQEELIKKYEKQQLEQKEVIGKLQKQG